MKHLIVIDDTGSPGSTNETRFLKDDRKTLVAVFINAEIRAEIEKLINGVLTILNKQFGITELHFTDIVNKKKQFSSLENDDVVSLIQILSSAFARFPLPYFVQTVHKDTLKENGINNKFKIDNFNLEKNEDAALMLLLIRLKSYLAREHANQTVEFVMDEGRRKNGISEAFKILENVSVDNGIVYKSSRDFIHLQVADFFAYSVNRMQMTVVKSVKTGFDKMILNELSIALSNQYSEGTSIIEIDLDNFSTDDYDYEQRAQREKDGNLDSWKDAQK
jgi:hypothetical protein